MDKSSNLVTTFAVHTFNFECWAQFYVTWSEYVVVINKAQNLFIFPNVCLKIRLVFDIETVYDFTQIGFINLKNLETHSFKKHLAHKIWAAHKSLAGPMARRPQVEYGWCTLYYKSIVCLVTTTSPKLLNNVFGTYYGYSSQLPRASI